MNGGPKVLAGATINGVKTSLAASELLTADELAARWRVPKSQVYGLTRRGVIPTVRLGRYYRYRLAAVEDFELGGGTADG